jgi:hypothetical protein
MASQSVGGADRTKLRSKIRAGAGAKLIGVRVDERLGHVATGDPRPEQRARFRHGRGVGTMELKS